MGVTAEDAEDTENGEEQRFGGNREIDSVSPNR